MNSNTFPPKKVTDLANIIIDKVMVATGMLAIIWIMLFLVVAMLGN